MPNRSLRMAVLAALSSAGALSAPYALADISFDGTLRDNANDVLNAVNGSYAITQDHGLTAGTNLFHSFAVFNLAQDEIAVFSGNAAITNIISRVTGESPTLINGTIRSTIDGANFWFVNPAGLTIGPTGSIDVSGAVALGTADSIDFAGGQQFFALPGDEDPAVRLLVSSPVDFGFLQDSGAGELLIQNDEFLARTTLVADDRQIQPLQSNATLDKFSLLLSGGAGVFMQSEGDLTLDDARIRTGSGSFTGPIDLMAEGSINISSSDVMTGTGLDGSDGDIVIQGGELVTISRSSLVSQMGGISIDAGEGLTVDEALLGASGALFSEQGASDPTGIHLSSAGQLWLNDATLRTDTTNGSSSSIALSGASAHISRSTITTSTIGTQDDFDSTGGISVSADDMVLIEGSTLRANSTNDGSPTTDPLGGAAGKIEVGASTLVRIDRSTIESSAKGVNGGAAGVVRFGGNAVDISNSSITLAAESLNPQVFGEENDGEDPSLQFIGGSFKLTNSTITATASGAANAATLLLFTSNGIEITDSTVQASTTGSGGAGAIFLFGFAIPFDLGPLDPDADPSEVPVGNPFLRITNSTLASSTGDIAAAAGAISASIDGPIDLQGAMLNVSATTRPELNPGFELSPGASAGGIQLFAGANPITVVDSTLQANTSGLVKGGGIDIDGSALLLRGSTITASSSAPNQGTSLDPIFGPSDPLASAGAINIGLGNVSIVDFDMEDPDMPAPEPVFGDVIIESSTISTNALATNGGDISIVGAGTALVLRDSSVLASAGGTGLGGDIAIFAMSEALVERSQLQALAEAGAGGTISIELNFGPSAPLTILSSSIATNATAADGGDIVLNSFGGNVLLRDSSVVASAGGSGIGGDISILNGDGATLQDSQIQALANLGSGGTITIALAEAASGPLQIQNSQVATNAAAADGGDISLDAMGNQVQLSGSTVVASAGGTGVGGDISILNAAGATLQNSQVQALADAGAGGTINIALDGSVVGTVAIDNSTITTNAMNADGGSISLDAAGQQVVMRGSSIVASAGGAGLGGDISILNASGATLQDSQIQALADAGTGGTINIGLVAGVAGPASIENSSITTKAMNAGGGSISFDAAGHQVTVRGSAIVASAGGSGMGGDISILNAAGASVQDSQFQALANAGTGGTISFILANGATAPMVFDNSTITTNATAANGGSIALDAAGNLVTLRNTSIVASAGGNGVGGDISIANASGATLQNTQIQALANAGAGGTISIALNGKGGPVVLDNSSITTNAAAANGGNISLDAAGNQLVMRNSSIVASAGGSGIGGDISIVNAGGATLQNSQIQALADAGAGGTIKLALAKGAAPLVLQNSAITTNAMAAGGGDISLDAAGNPVVMRDSTIRASAGAAGTGGNILINAAGRTILQRSQILARADAGNGGTITINLITGALFIRDAQSLLSADSNSGNDGAIDINSPDTDLNPAVKPQDVGIGSTPELSANACAPAGEAGRSTFVRENRGGVSTSPDGYLASFETAATTPKTASAPTPGATRVAMAEAHPAAMQGCR